MDIDGVVHSCKPLGPPSYLTPNWEQGRWGNNQRIMDSIWGAAKGVRGGKGATSRNRPFLS